MQQSAYLKLIAKSLSGQLTAAEQELLDQWLGESGEHEQLYNTFKSAWEQPLPQPVTENEEKVYGRLLKRIQHADDTIHTLPVNPAGHSFYRWCLRIAAVAFMIASVGGLVWLQYSSRFKTDPTASSKATPAITVLTRPGQRERITLPDGSLALLNAASKLTYQVKHNTRCIDMEGEVFFEVAKNAAQPFIVTAGNIKVQVLGTAFNVKAYAGETIKEVALQSGKVAISHTSQSSAVPMALAPAEIMQIDIVKHAVKVMPIDNDKIFGWKDGLLVFENASFREIAEQLERWYGVEFRILRKQPVQDGFYGKYRNKPLDVVLKGISFASDFKYRIEGNIVYIE